MSSSDFSKVKVIDDVLATTDSVRYAVIKGAQNITPGKYTAISNSNSSITFNIQTPSEATVLSRRMMLRNTITITCTGTIPANSPVNTRLVNLGETESLGPFPFQSLCNTVQMTINNNTVSQNMRDVMFALLRFGDRREMARYNNSAPTAYDNYWNYANCVGSTNSPLSAWNDCSLDEAYQGRGVSRIKSISGNTAFGGAAAEIKTVVIVFETIEPLMLSPLIWCDPESNNQGFYGVQVLNLTLNIGSANRLFRSAQAVLGPLNTAGNLVCTLGSVAQPDAFQEPQLLIQYYTRQPSDLVPARNVVPFAEYPRYLSSGSAVITAAVQTNAAGAYSLVPGSTSQFASQTISLNSIPDRLIIFARKTLATQTAYDADCFFPIQRIVVNFNNKSGLLSSATQWDLWRMSVESGSNATWAEFSGVAGVSRATALDNFGLTQVATSGAPLVLSMGKHVELDDVFAPGSIGQFQLQFQVDLLNYDTNAYGTTPQNQWELVLITQNTGVFVLERGTSQTYTAILSRSDVLAASSQPGYSSSAVKRLVGGSIEDGFKDLSGMGESGSGPSGSGPSGSGPSGSGPSGSGPSGSGNSGSGVSGGRRLSKHLC
jgi:hypothetical protein|nr:MAG: putative major capsid protein [Lake Baikal virophage 2]